MKQISDAAKVVLTYAVVISLFGFFRFLLIHPVQHLLFCLSCSHFYKPLLRKGFGKMVSQSAVFFLSAFFHEVRSEIEALCSVYVGTVHSSQGTIKCPKSGAST